MPARLVLFWDLALQVWTDRTKNLTYLHEKANYWYSIFCRYRSVSAVPLSARRSLQTEGVGQEAQHGHHDRGLPLLDVTRTIMVILPCSWTCRWATWQSLLWKDETVVSNENNKGRIWQWRIWQRTFSSSCGQSKKRKLNVNFSYCCLVTSFLGISLKK